MIRGVNHITFAVSELDRSFAFYADLLGFKARARWPKGAYFSAGNLWFCIVQDQDTRSGPMREYTHLAFSIDAADFQLRSQMIRDAGSHIWKENQSEGDSLYFLDPDGHKLELHVSDLEERLRSARQDPWDGLQFFD